MFYPDISLTVATLFIICFKLGCTVVRRLEQNNRFIFQYIDNKAQFYWRKVREDLYFAIFLPNTQNYLYHRKPYDYGRQIFCTLEPYLASVNNNYVE